MKRNKNKVLFLIFRKKMDSGRFRDFINVLIVGQDYTI